MFFQMKGSTKNARI